MHMHIVKPYRSTKGFTLIELMIAVSVVAILVALAVPAYSDYIIRSKVAECINGAAPAKIGITEYQQTMGPWPPSLGDAGLLNTGDSTYCNGMYNYDSSTGAFAIDVDEAVIDADAISGDLAPVMEPTITSSNIVNWDCTRGTTAASDLKYLPSTCRDT